MTTTDTTMSRAQVGDYRDIICVQFRRFRSGQMDRYEQMFADGEITMETLDTLTKELTALVEKVESIRDEQFWRNVATSGMTYGQVMAII